MKHCTIGDLDALIGRIASELDGRTAEENQGTYDQIERAVLAACECLGISPGEYYVRYYRADTREELLSLSPGEAYDMQLQRLNRIIDFRVSALTRKSDSVAA